MRWPIHRQILWPFAGVVALSVALLTGVAATRAARRSEDETRSRLQNTVETLARLEVPYTTAVLSNMRGFSGAHFVACDDAGNVLATTLPTEEPFSPELAREGTEGELSTLGARPTLRVGKDRFYGATIQPRMAGPVRTLYVLFSADDWARSRRDAALPSLWAGGLALVLTFAVSIWLAERFGRRLRQLQERVAGIAAGDFREIPPGSRDDEIQDLVTSVNRMAGQLQRMQETIRQSERTRLLAQLAGGLAHQLRNAATGARMALQLHTRRCPDKTEQSLDVALRQLSLMETQIKGLLSLGRSEHRPRVPCDLAELLPEIELLLAPQCQHAGVRLELALEAGRAPGVVVEVEALRAAVLNLVLNAMEAAGRGGRVVLSARHERSQAIVEIADTGEGPADDVAANLFEPFNTSKAEGVGLGLALARQVATDHGGTLTWCREHELTVFRLALPLADGDEAGMRRVQSEIHNPKSAIPV